MGQNNQTRLGPVTEEAVLDLVNRKSDRAGVYSMVSKAGGSRSSESFIREIPMLSTDTLDRMLRARKGAHSGYTISGDALGGSMCFSFPKGMAVVTVLRGEVKVALYTPTSGGPSVILTDSLALELLTR